MQHADLCSLLLRALRYEHWLRFHFMEDILSSGEDECMDAVLHVPEEQVELERRENPDLFPVLEFLQGRPLSMKLSRDAVFRHVAQAAGRDVPDAEFGAEMFELVSDPDFRRGLDLFHGRVQELADGEESEPVCRPSGAPAFQEWERAFRSWAARQAVQRVTVITPYEDKPEEDR